MISMYSYSTPLSFIHLGLLVINLTIFVPILEQCAILKFESVNILHPLHVPNRSTSRFIELRETLGIQYTNGDGKKTGLFPGLLCYCYTIKKYKKLNLVSFAGRVVKKYAKLLDIIIIAKQSKIVFLSQILPRAQSSADFASRTCYFLFLNIYISLSKFIFSIFSSELIYLQKILMVIPFTF